jgi:hypothetical protein
LKFCGLSLDSGNCFLWFADTLQTKLCMWCNHLCLCLFLFSCSEKNCLFAQLPVFSYCKFRASSVAHVLECLPRKS